MLDWLRRLFRHAGTKTADEQASQRQESARRAEAFAARMAKAMENAWWSGQEALVGKTDEPLAVVGPRSGTSAQELVQIGQQLHVWQQANSCARHIWGLDDLLAGRLPRTPPIYLMVPYSLDRIAESIEPVALAFVAAGTDHKAAAESLGQALGESRSRLAWFTDPDDYGNLQR